MERESTATDQLTQVTLLQSGSTQYFRNGERSGLALRGHLESQEVRGDSQGLQEVSDLSAEDSHKQTSIENHQEEKPKDLRIYLPTLLSP